MKKLTVAVIGAGNRGQTYTNIMKDLEQYEVVGQAARHAISASSYRCAHNDWTLGGIGCRIKF